MNHRQLQRELIYARIAFYVCMALALFVGYKGYTSATQSGRAVKADMFGVTPSGNPSMDQNSSSGVQGLLSRIQHGIASSGAKIGFMSGLVSGSTSTGATQNQPDSQTPLVAYALKSLPSNMATIRSVSHIESQLEQGDTTQAGPVDVALAHPLAHASDSQSSDRDIDRAVAQVSSGQATSLVGGNSRGGQSLIPQVAGAGQEMLSDIGLSFPSSPWLLGVICFAFGLAAPRMFKRRDPAVIYRPQVVSRPPSIYDPNWQGNSVQYQPRQPRPEGYCQYQAYFVGQELEHRGYPGTPVRAAYGLLRRASTQISHRTTKMVRRFLEL